MISKSIINILIIWLYSQLKLFRCLRSVTLWEWLQLINQDVKCLQSWGFVSKRQFQDQIDQARYMSYLSLIWKGKWLVYLAAVPLVVMSYPFLTLTEWKVMVCVEPGVSLLWCGLMLVHQDIMIQDASWVKYQSDGISWLMLTQIVKGQIHKNRPWWMRFESKSVDDHFRASFDPC